MFRSFLITSLSVTCVLASVVNAEFNLTIAFINDHHSHLPEEIFTVKSKYLPADVSLSDTSYGVKVAYGGFPRLVALYKNLTVGLTRPDSNTIIPSTNSTSPARAASSNATDTGASGQNLLTLHSGDITVGTLFFNLYNGTADANLMRQFCFDAMALGNHEFDKGDAFLANVLAQVVNMTGSPCAYPTRILSANIQDTVSPIKPYVYPYTVISFNNGNDLVGVIGLTTVTTKQISQPDNSTDFSDPANATAMAVAELEAMGVNKIIVLSHLGYDLDITALAEVPGVDVIVGGHSHTMLGNATQEAFLYTPPGPYPTINTTNGQIVCIIQAWCYGHVLGMLDVLFDDSGNVLSCTGIPRVPINGTMYAQAKSGNVTNYLDSASTASMTAYLESLGIYVPTEPDPSTVAALQPYVDGVNAFGSHVIAQVPQPGLCNEEYPGAGTSAICQANSTVLGLGGDACAVVAQAYLAQVAEGDVSITNSGGFVSTFLRETSRFLVPSRYFHLVTRW